MKLIAKSMYFDTMKEVSYAYFDIKHLLPSIEEDELLIKICIINNKLDVMYHKIAKQKLSCYYIDLEKLKFGIIKYIKKNPYNLIPHNYHDTEYDHVILKLK